MAAKAGAAKIVITPPNYEWIHVTVRGTTPLIMNAFPAKARQELKDMDQNAKKAKVKRNPLAEVNEALYRIPGEDEAYGLPAAGFKKAMVQVAKDIPGKEINGRFIMRQIFVEADAGDLVRLQTQSGWRAREDIVRIGNGSPSLRYRPQFDDWSVALRIRYDADILDAQSVLNLLARAGMGIGWGEMRGEQGYTYGAYEIEGEAKIVGRAA